MPGSLPSVWKSFFLTSLFSSFSFFLSLFPLFPLPLIQRRLTGLLNLGNILHGHWECWKMQLSNWRNMKWSSQKIFVRFGLKSACSLSSRPGQILLEKTCSTSPLYLRCRNHWSDLKKISAKDLPPLVGNLFPPFQTKGNPKQFSNFCIVDELIELALFVSQDPPEEVINYFHFTLNHNGEERKIKN